NPSPSAPQPVRRLPIQSAARSPNELAMASDLSTRTGPATRPARYRGLTGALAYGLMILSFFTVLALLGGAVMLLLTGNFRLLQFLSTRLFLLGFVAAGAAALARWICRGSADRVFTRKLVAGDVAGAG